MSTNSTISYVREDGLFVSIYCHWDGYLSHNGKILFDNVTTQEHVEYIVNRGDMSSIDVDDNGLIVCDYYADKEYETFENNKPSVDCKMNKSQEYNYIFKDGEWYMCRKGSDTLIELTEFLVSEENARMFR